MGNDPSIVFEKNKLPNTDEETVGTFVEIAFSLLLFCRFIKRKALSNDYSGAQLVPARDSSPIMTLIGVTTHQLEALRVLEAQGVTTFLLPSTHHCVSLIYWYQFFSQTSSSGYMDECAVS